MRARAEGRNAGGLRPPFGDGTGAFVERGAPAEWKYVRDVLLPGILERARAMNEKESIRPE